MKSTWRAADYESPWAKPGRDIMAATKKTTFPTGRRVPIIIRPWHPPATNCIRMHEHDSLGWMLIRPDGTYVLVEKTWTPFNHDGTLKDLAAQGWHEVGAIRDDRG